MKICFISHSAGQGGAEKALVELIDALKERGVNCYVILPSQGPFIKELKNLGVKYSVLPYLWWMDKKNSPLWKRIARMIINIAMIIPVAIKIKQQKCNVVYTNTITVCVGVFAAKLLGLPHIWHIHEFGYEDQGLLFDLGSKLSLRIMNNFSSFCIANSNAVAQYYQKYITPSKLKVVYQSVKVPVTYLYEKIAWPKADIRCVIVGALNEGKRQEDAIRAIKELLEKGVKAVLYVIGHGDPKYRKYLDNLVMSNKLNNYVKLIGHVEKPFSFIQSADIVLMCSVKEAFGRVTIEAMKAGKPVIGTRSGGTQELIRDSFNGLLYTPGDHKQLAEKIRYLYKHPKVAQQIGENGYKWASEHFTQDCYGEEMLIILRHFT